MKKFEEPIVKIIKSTTPDILTSSIEDIDNVKVGVEDIFTPSDPIEDNFFI